MRMTNADSEATNVAVEDVSPTAYARRTVTVDFLFLDRESCARCVGTEGALEAAVDRVAGLLSDVGVDLEVRRVHVDSAVAARLTGLAVSPTVRVNGRDVQSGYDTSPCESCGDLCGCVGTVDCRVWTYRGEEYDVAPVELIVEAILREAVASRDSDTAASTPAASAPVSAAVESGTTSGRLSDPLRELFGGRATAGTPVVGDGEDADGGEDARDGEDNRENPAVRDGENAGDDAAVGDDGRECC